MLRITIAPTEMNEKFLFNFELLNVTENVTVIENLVAIKSQFFSLAELCKDPAACSVFGSHRSGNQCHHKTKNCGLVASLTECCACISANLIPIKPKRLLLTEIS